MLDGPIDLPTNVSLHMSGFFCVIYAILNASVILKKNKMRLVRNEMRGGNLPLSGTVMNSSMYVLSIENQPFRH